MPFDPDKYLQGGVEEKPTSTFNPDAYLGEDKPSQLESGLRGFAQGGSFGFIDELTGLAESAFTPKTYTQARDESRANYKAAEEANPNTYLAGEIGGGLATMAVPGVGALGTAAKGAKGLKGLAQVAAGSGLIGGVSAAGASEAEDVKELGMDALQGTAFGAAFGGALHSAGKVISGVGGKAKEFVTTSEALKGFTNKDTVISNMAKVAKAQSEKDFGTKALGGVSEVDEHLAQLKNGAFKLDTKAIKNYETAYKEVDKVLDGYSGVRRHMLEQVKNPDTIKDAAEKIKLKLKSEEDLLKASDTALTPAEMNKITETFGIASGQMDTISSNPSATLADLDKVRRDFYAKITDKEWIEGAKTVKEAPKRIGDSVLGILDETVGESQPSLSGKLRDVGIKMNAAMEMKDAFAKGAIAGKRDGVDYMNFATGALGGIGIGLASLTGAPTTAGLVGALIAKKGIDWAQTPSGRLKISSLVQELGEQSVMKLLNNKSAAVKNVMDLNIPDKVKFSLLRKLSTENTLDKNKERKEVK